MAWEPGAAAAMVDLARYAIADPQTPDAQKLFHGRTEETAG